ncbi:MAG: hypothetical protein JKY54_08745 [Flavobacteriales bacterium]|nr:hypothetical protein [Flavobacteriales bacterium]
MKPQIPKKEELEFRKMSAVFTGFSQADLQGTGLNELLFNTIQKTLATGILNELLELFDDLCHKHEQQSAFKDEVRKQIFESEKYGPLARNIIQVWYTGTWYQMADDWIKYYGSTNNVDFIVSAESYVNGLVWPAIGSHPMGAKQEGFGTWAFKPPSYHQY